MVNYVPAETFNSHMLIHRYGKDTIPKIRVCRMRDMEQYEIIALDLISIRRFD